MLEKDLEKKIVKLAKELGYITFKFISPSNRGVPDRIFINSYGYIFFMEFKSPTGKLSKSQENIFNKLKLRHVDIYVVYEYEIAKIILKREVNYEYRKVDLN